MTQKTTHKLIVTGMMGAGKSSVGPIVAKRLGWKFIDTDAEIVARTGKPIARIFQKHGEPYFRELERGVIARVAGSSEGAVIATGGGALTDHGSAAALARAGVIICLTARPEVLAERVGQAKGKRPKLTEGGKPLLDRIKELIAERAEAYARADAQVDTSEMTIEQAADAVVKAFTEQSERRCAPSQ
ncbi:MAG TPA: shikimate kinase [Candidatus Binataceae bacterium]|nr:shikimate kinase [Candidatus Binataceae bacterium]